MDFDTVSVDKDTDRFADAGIVPVSHCVDDRLAQRFDGILGEIFALEAVDLRANTGVELQEICGLVDQLREVPQDVLSVYVLPYTQAIRIANADDLALRYLELGVIAEHEHPGVGRPDLLCLLVTRRALQPDEQILLGCIAHLLPAALCPVGKVALHQIRVDILSRPSGFAAKPTEELGT